MDLCREEDNHLFGFLTKENVPTMDKNCSESAFEFAIDLDLLARGYMAVDKAGFDRERAIFPEVALAFIRETQPKEWGKLEALHGAKTGDLVLVDLCRWMDAHGSLATLRHGFKCFGRTLRVAFFKAAHGLNPELEARYKANRVGITRQLAYSRRRLPPPRRHLGHVAQIPARQESPA